VTEGHFDLRFALYGFETGGEPLWTEVQKRVAVRDGLFAVTLGRTSPLPASVAEADAWLAVAVRGPGEAEFTALNPRLKLSAASPVSPVSPNAGAACAHDHLGETWEGTGDWLTIRNTNTGNEAVLPGLFSGVYGYSEAWTGVHGQSTDFYGVYGQSTNECGVYGYSESESGVHGYSDSDHGVYGRTSGEWGWTSGVYGEASKTNANGVTGWNTGDGVGVYGHSETGNAGYFAGRVYVRGNGNTVGSEGLRVDNSDSLLGLSVRDDGTVAIGALSGSAAAHICSRIESADARNVLAVCSSAAEYVPTVDRGLGFPETGDLVSIVPTARNPYGDEHAPFAVAKAASSYDPNLVGFISDSSLGADGVKLNDRYLPLAIYGYFPVKVTMHNGPVKRGDPITSSPQPGYGMKATEPGRIVGYALEDADKEGAIQVVVQVGDHLGDAPARLEDLEGELLSLKQEQEKLLQQNADLEARMTALEALVAAAVEDGGR